MPPIYTNTPLNYKRQAAFNNPFFITTASDPFAMDVLLYLNGDNFLDLSSTGRTITNVSNVVTLDTTLKKYGTSSYKYASGGVLTIPNNSGVTSPNNLTIEFWCHYNQSAYSFTGLFQFNYDGVYDGILTSEQARAAEFENTTAIHLFSNVDLAIDNVANSWHHFAITIQGTQCKIYQNGILKHTVTRTFPTLNSDAFSVGTYLDGTRYFRGNIDCFRVTNAIRYTTNFNPETDTYLAY